MEGTVVTCLIGQNGSSAIYLIGLVVGVPGERVAVEDGSYFCSMEVGGHGPGIFGDSHWAREGARRMDGGVYKGAVGIEFGHEAAVLIIWTSIKTSFFFFFSNLSVRIEVVHPYDIHTLPVGDVEHGAGCAVIFGLWGIIAVILKKFHFAAILEHQAVIFDPWLSPHQKSRSIQVATIILIVNLNGVLAWDQQQSAEVLVWRSISLEVILVHRAEHHEIIVVNCSIWLHNFLSVDFIAEHGRTDDEHGEKGALFPIALPPTLGRQGLGRGFFLDDWVRGNRLSLPHLNLLGAFSLINPLHLKNDWEILAQHLDTRPKRSIFIPICFIWRV